MSDPADISEEVGEELKRLRRIIDCILGCANPRVVSTGLATVDHSAPPLVATDLLNTALTAPPLIDNPVNSLSKLASGGGLAGECRTETAKY